MPDLPVTITTDHILDGITTPAGNPVALAVHDAFPDASWVVAGAQVLYLTAGGWRYEYALADEARAFLASFFAGKAVGPLRFSVPAEPVFAYRFRLAATRRDVAA